MHCRIRPEAHRTLDNLLSATGLSVFRGDRCLFRNLEFALNPGELLSVEGANGSGKTSLLRGLAGLLEFEAGELCWNGTPVSADYQSFRAELAWFSHRVGLKGDLNPVENLLFECALRPSSPLDLPKILERLGLQNLTDLPVRYLSAGQQRRVALARLLLSAGRLWIMDEPFTNLDKDGRDLVADLITGHLGQGGLCIAASHQSIDVDATIHRINIL